MCKRSFQILLTMCISIVTVDRHIIHRQLRIAGKIKRFVRHWLLPDKS